MREISIIQEELRDVDSLIFEIRESIIQFPDDAVLFGSLSQYSFIRTNLLAELDNALALENSHVIDIAIKKEANPTFSEISRVLDSFQLAINSVRSFLSNRIEEIDLQFAATFQGSFGIKAVTVADNKLILGDIYQAINKLFEINEGILSLSNTDELSKNKTAVRSLAKFYGKLAEVQIDVEVKWNSPSNEQKRYLFTKDDSLNKRSKLLQLDIAETVEYDLSGILKEVNLLNNTCIVVVEGKKKKQRHILSFENPEKELIKGLLEKSLTVKVKHSKEWDYEQDKLIETKLVQKISRLTNVEPDGAVVS